jgi:probable rRNA maturation factor
MKRLAVSRLAVSALHLLPASARRRNLIEKAVALTFKAEKASLKGELNIVFVDKKRMLQLNKQFLHHTHDTDVIAFNYDGAPEGADSPFGDVFVSAPQARLQAEQLGHSVLEETLTLVIHGTLHLLGYDDATPKQKAVMLKKQSHILDALNR